MLGRPTSAQQNGQAVNLTTETGEAYQAWPDWNAPYSRIWIDARGEGAVYSPDGMRIQFDDGRVWQRDIGPPSPVVFRRAPVVYTKKLKRGQRRSAPCPPLAPPNPNPLSRPSPKSA